MNRLLILALTLLSFFGCGGNDFKIEENERPFRDEVEYLAGAEAEFCGSVQSILSSEEMEEQINNCVVDAFYSYQAFYSYYNYYGAFLGDKVEGIAFDGIDLYIISADDLSCSLDKGSDCNRIYTEAECVDPTIREINNNESSDKHPFECSEKITL